MESRKFENRVETMREKCDHIQQSEWIEEGGLLGIPTGYEVRVCSICGQIIGRRRKPEEKAEPRRVK
jgi:NMD protein affecting ribosome stability and mRNA decay